MWLVAEQHGRYGGFLRGQVLEDGHRVRVRCEVGAHLSRNVRVERCGNDVSGLPGSMERVIRVMLHFYGPVEHVPVHVYVGEAQKLRTDLEAAQ